MKMLGCRNCDSVWTGARLVAIQIDQLRVNPNLRLRSGIPFGKLLSNSIRSCQVFQAFRAFVGAHNGLSFTF
jgi:hypothetical protein